MNKHAIELIKGKQPFYGSIYAFCLVELETLKAYIETHLKTEFIQLSKSPTGTHIFINQKLDSNLHLCMDYQGLNNLTVMTWSLNLVT